MRSPFDEHAEEKQVQASSRHRLFSRITSVKRADLDEAQVKQCGLDKVLVDEQVEQEGLAEAPDEQDSFNNNVSDLPAQLRYR